MAVNWDLVVKIAGPLLLLLTGAALTHFTERRSKLITYYGHVGTLTVQQRPLHTHVVVIRNVGRKPATNVRVSHQSCRITISGLRCSTVSRTCLAAEGTS
jgi:hypothetical protein